jgi:chromate transporter
MTLFRLFLILVKIGAILLGGGYVIFPIMESEFVQKRALVKYEDLLDFFALSQSLPGIIAANMSMFVGYKLKGKWGAVVAMLGIIFVPFWCIVLLAAVLNTIINNTQVQGALWGVGVAVIALIILTVREVWQKSKRNLFFYTIFLLALAGLLIFKLTPIQAIIIFSCFGILIKRIRRRA